jgi:Bacterial protein of unknown function (DUF894).
LARGTTGLGDGIRLSVLPLLTASLTRDATLVGGVSAFATAPWLLFGLPAGAIVDRFDRRVLLVAANAIRALTIGLVAASIFGGWASIPLVYLLAFVNGSTETVISTASSTVLPSLVSAEQLAGANVRLSIVDTATSEFVGPSLGGLVFALSAGAALALNAAVFALGALTVTGIPTRPAPGNPRPKLRHALVEGLRWMIAHQLVRFLCLGVGVVAFIDSAWFAILVLYARRILHLGGFGFGLLLTIGGIGSIAAGFAVMRLTRSITRGGAMLAAVSAMGVSQLTIGLTSDRAVTAAMLALSGAAFTVWNVCVVTLRQSLVPDELLGRVTSAYLFVGFGATAIGAVSGGALANTFGIRAPFLAGAPLLGVLLLGLRRSLLGAEQTAPAS